MRCAAADWNESCGTNCPLDRFSGRPLFYLERPGLLWSLLAGFGGLEVTYGGIEGADPNDPKYRYDLAASVGLSETLEPFEAARPDTDGYAFLMAAIACARRKAEGPSDGGA